METKGDAAGPEEIRAALRPVVEGPVRIDPYTLHLYSGDASMYAIEPLAVAFPRHADDVAAIVAAAAELGVPVLPRGAGTSLAGQAVGRAIVLDFARHLNGIVGIDPAARLARVQPGVVQDQLNRAAAGAGLMFGPDTSTSDRATLGGMIGNNSAGSHSVRYGSTIDHVEALEVVLSDARRARLGPVGPAEAARRGAAEGVEGRVFAELPEILAGVPMDGFPPYWRHSGGYRIDRALRPDGGLDLARLIVGSEGTLAVVTEATVALVPRPAARAIAVGHFRSTAAALAAVGDALDQGPASVELLDETVLRLSRDRPDYAALTGILEGSPAALLFVEFFGDGPVAVRASAEALAARWRRGGHGYHTLRAFTPEHRTAVTKVRKAALGLVMASSTGSRRPLAFVEDTAVPPDRLESYVRDFKEILDRYGMRAGFYGHCSVGCLHIRPFVDLRQPGEIAAMRAVAEEVADLAARYGGVNSSEHGDGLVRSQFNPRVLGPERYAAMRRVKRAFDPDGRLNPGKIVDAPPMTEHLRDPAMPPARPVPVQLRFPAGSMRDAADRCVNIGVCRKEDAGVMCPSFMATREEEHSTRGRANALVKALSAPDPRAELGSERLHGILDLCLECKACKSECPLGVDMASLKSEALHHYYAVHGTPLRARAFGAIRGLNRLGSAFAPLSNWPGRNRPARALLDRWLGISRQRPLPRFSRDNLLRWSGRRTPSGPFPHGDVVFIADSFTTYTEPSVGRAAVTLLERAGWRVQVAGGGCCGRPQISKGLLPQAKRQASAMLDRLAPMAARGVPITGVEPSCVLTLRDEYAALLPSDSRMKQVADATRLVPELLVEAIDAGRLVLDPSGPLRGRQILLHGHCHEKAGTGTAATRALLERIPGAQVRELDAGCCGMAGSFGYESEHYELSMRIGGLRLFPALAAEPEALVAATGVSCRQQIAHGGGRRAYHPVELVARSLS